MTTPEGSAERAASALRSQGESFVGSAMTRAIAALRRAKYDDEASELERVFVSLASAIEQPAIVPAHVRDAIDAYVEAGRPPGSFLYCVLTNDLTGACLRAADDASRHSLASIVRYLRENVPQSCWGSAEHVMRWYTLPDDERRLIVVAYRGYEIVDESATPTRREQS
jgi:hypothetical protein